MKFINKVQDLISQAVNSLYSEVVEAKNIGINQTPSEYEGQLTVLVFPFVRFSKLKPEETAQQLGQYLMANCTDLRSFNVVKGFLNLDIKPAAWIQFLLETADLGENYGKAAQALNKKVVLEYSSPNTNKPLHLGHIRNNLLGYSMAQILEFVGYEVVKTQVINDRGVHICKSMLAWKLFGNGETPESSNKKGDHLVGDYYVRFESEFQSEFKQWQNTPEASAIFDDWFSKNGAKAFAKVSLKDPNDLDEKKAYFFKEVHKNTYFKETSPLGKACNQMLQDWENNVEEVRLLWTKMNGWVYEGMNLTYKNLGVSFDKNYYESNTYLTGKEMIEVGLNNGVFTKREDNSVWIDLTDVKLDEKLVIRSNGTSVYITQDIGLAAQRFEEFGMDKMIYVVGDEQEYHFKVLFEILKRLGQPYSKDLYHLSYGMVELTTGKMKSREGTVVDADNLMDEVFREVKAESSERATLQDLTPQEQDNIYRQVALGALKFFILKVDPKKRMVFDPKQSIDFQGFTGPYIQNAYVKTQAVQRKAKELALGDAQSYLDLEPSELEICMLLHNFNLAVQSAATTYNPADLANYAYNLAKSYHRFWAEVPVLRANDPNALAFRIKISQAVAATLKNAMGLLGVSLPDRM
jgi:arginyl-tRNA synthetase